MACLLGGYPFLEGSSSGASLYIHTLKVGFSLCTVEPLIKDPENLPTKDTLLSPFPIAVVH